jgi:hypothetical protein
MKSSVLSPALQGSNQYEKRNLLVRFKKSKIVDVICFLFILLFVYAAVSKLLDYEKFTVQLSKSPILTRFSGIISWLIPGIEIVVSIIIAIPKFRLVGLYSGFCLMMLFTFYIVDITQFNNGDIPCTCGGVLQNMSWNQHLAFNTLFSILGLFGILLYQPPSIKNAKSISLQ